jgi:hypothetical protein
VRLLKTVFTMLVLVNWFACTLHCELEKTGLLRKASPAGNSTKPSVSETRGNVDSDVCDWVANGGLDASGLRVTAPEFAAVPLLAFVGSNLGDLAALPDEPCVQRQGSLAPPELLRPSVHFVCRTALPARAPSLA